MSSFIDPVALFWFLLVLLGLVFLFKRRRLCGLVLLTLCAAWWFLEVTALPGRLLAGLERPYLGTGHPPAADAIIVLGGGAAASSNDFAGLDFGVAADRVLTGMELGRRRLGKVLVLGGSATREPEIAPEPRLMRRWIESWDVSRLPVMDLGPCRNTSDEAKRAAELARENGWKQVLLVTSAWHLKRAEGAFRRAGLDVIPVGCDFMGTASLGRRSGWIPQTRSLVMLQTWLHEVVGGWYYKWQKG